MSRSELSKDNILGGAGQLTRLCAGDLQTSGKIRSPMHAWPLSCMSHKDSSVSPDQFLVHVHDHSRYIDGRGYLRTQERQQERPGSVAGLGPFVVATLYRPFVPGDSRALEVAVALMSQLVRCRGRPGRPGPVGC